MGSTRATDHMRARPLVALAAAAASSLALGWLLGRTLRTAGATDEEVAARLPGDHLVPTQDLVSTRARTLPAPPERVWPWLAQMGHGRAGWYSLDAVEALLGVARATAADGTTSRRSLHELVPRHQVTAVGDRVPLSPRSDLAVAAIAPPEHLVLVLHAGGGRWGLDWCWTWQLRAAAGGTTRLVVRTRVAVTPRLLAPAVRLLLDPGHAVMELVQLRNLARRVEAAT